MMIACSLRFHFKFSRQIFVGFFFYCEKIRHIVYVTKTYLINENAKAYK